MRDSQQYVAILWTTWLSGQSLGSGERQPAVSGNILDPLAIRAVPWQWWETSSSLWQYIGPLGYQGSPLAVMRDSQQSVAILWTTWLSGQSLDSGERHPAVCGNTLDHLAIRADLGSDERQPAVCGNTLDHLAIRAGLGSDERQPAVCGNTLDHLAIRTVPWQWWETDSSQWQYLRPLGYQGSPSAVVRDSQQSVAILWTTWLSGQSLGSGERQPAVCGNTLDNLAIRAVPWQWWETASSQWQYLKPLCYKGQVLAVVRDSQQSVAIP